MKIHKIRAAAAAALALAILLPVDARAHCDTLDGPVVAAAQRALDTGNVNHVLYWVGAAGEREVRDAFEQARAVRTLGARAQTLADRYFFETVVRVHRAGEGEPYTGLKPAGLDPGPAIAAADRSLADRSPASVLRLLTTTMETRVHGRLEEAVAARDFNVNDLDAGRRFVRAYVAYLHYVEALYEATTAGPGHLHETVK